MKLFIVDDDPLILKSLAATLSREEEISVEALAENGERAVSLCAQNPPDVILMDIRMPGMDGIQATHILKKQFPHLKIVMLTTFQDKGNIQSALKAGAEGYLLKTDRLSDMAGKLRLVLEGTSVISSEALKALAVPSIPSTQGLTPREREVLELVVKGLTNREIGEQLYLSEGTVRNVVSVIMDKMDVRNRTELSSAVLGQ